MAEPEFDAAERIAGFPLVEIKGALFQIGLLNDRDDVGGLARALKCGRPQAERVLAAMERRGLIEKAANKQQREWTALGKRLAFSWHPPRRIEPAIYRDDDDNSTSENFGSVPCSIVRLQGDDEMLEEADLEAGVYVDLESERIVQIEVMQPDDYDHRDECGSVVDTAVLLSVADAKKFAEALQKAIAAGEAEIARRATIKPRKRQRDPEPATVSPTTKASAARPDQPSTQARPHQEPSSSSRGSKGDAAAASKSADRTAAQTKAKLAATLKELGNGRSRR